MTLAEFITINRARVSQQWIGVPFDLACLIADVPVLLDIVEVQAEALAECDAERCQHTAALRCLATNSAMYRTWCGDCSSWVTRRDKKSPASKAQAEVEKLIADGESDG